MSQQFQKIKALQRARSSQSATLITRLVKEVCPRCGWDGSELTDMDRLLRVFGSIKSLRNALYNEGHPYHPVTIYRWSYPPPKGRGGSLPLELWPAISRAASRLGVKLP